MAEKAYKLLAEQEYISNKKAKELIDKGVVSVNGQKLVVARGLMKESTVFKVKEIAEAKVIFQDDDILVVDKPAFLNAYEVADSFPHCILLNRLDKETSGVMMFAKNEEFRTKAIKEFAQHKVYKEYVAVVEGKFIEEVEINQPILTIKGKTARSKIDSDRGKPAKTTLTPNLVEGNKSKIKVVIENGRTHQIRVHCQYAGYPIIGDAQYGKTVPQVHRMLLHSKVTRILHYEFQAKEPREFYFFDFNK
ncbi:MAG: RNA pseudouridine synthase [Epsilonproteobacteria bacterium]|nr:MAG: RNA pseudouridine synthase [Campylobacterota bacterium]